MRKRQRPAAARPAQYLCHACGKLIERTPEPGTRLKRWRKSYCTATGRDVRIWLQISHATPHKHQAH